jgi:hypothetical protein
LAQKLPFSQGIGGKLLSKETIIDGYKILIFIKFLKKTHTSKAAKIAMDFFDEDSRVK